MSSLFLWRLLFGRLFWLRWRSGFSGWLLILRLARRRWLRTLLEVVLPSHYLPPLSCDGGFGLGLAAGFGDCCLIWTFSRGGCCPSFFVPIRSPSP